ncbi:hypothetical protein B0T16DRAFT_219086 [Cercophora newfieldiana]|uniref:C2H2-type domain-containing protein n=1 Tax=Cercophora newfieldiana TaxID=92897 RepID=A0AA39XXM8_9PEZI|nr:hypothetical protein B0T16DRAFT_219086 [Cercophora newfieldiana]
MGTGRRQFCSQTKPRKGDRDLPSTDATRSTNMKASQRSPDGALFPDPAPLPSPHAIRLEHSRAPTNWEIHQVVGRRIKTRSRNKRSDASGACQCQRCRATRTVPRKSTDRPTLAPSTDAWRVRYNKQRQPKDLPRILSAQGLLQGPKSTQDLQYRLPSIKWSILLPYTLSTMNLDGLPLLWSSLRGGDEIPLKQVDRGLILGESSRHDLGSDHGPIFDAGEKKGRGGGPQSPQAEEREPSKQAWTSANHAQSGSKRPLSRDGKNGRKGKCEDDEDSENEDRKEKKRRSEGTDDQPRKFACPFFKHNPQRYGSERSCLGPGWISVHRVKEHIFRRHTQPPYCNRCFEVFSDQTSLFDHLRMSPPCSVRGVKKPEGIDSTQIMKLRKRGRKSANEVERWHEMYRIIFPGEEDIPSPYHYAVEAKLVANPSEIQQWQRFFVDNLPARIDRLVSNQMPDETGELRGRQHPLVDIIREAIVEAFDDLRISPRGLTDYAPNQRRDSDSTTPPSQSLWPETQFLPPPLPMNLPQDPPYPSILDDNVQEDWSFPGFGSHWADPALSVYSGANSESSAGNGPPAVPTRGDNVAASTTIGDPADLVMAEYFATYSKEIPSLQAAGTVNHSVPSKSAKEASTSAIEPSNFLENGQTDASEALEFPQ